MCKIHKVSAVVLFIWSKEERRGKQRASVLEQKEKSPPERQPQRISYTRKGRPGEERPVWERDDQHACALRERSSASSR